MAITVSPNTEKVVNYLKANYGSEFTKQEIADALGISLSAVIGVINQLVRKECVTERLEEVEVAPATETKKAQIKVVRHETLTEKGLSYDPIAEAEARDAAQKAARAAKRAAKNAEE